MGEVQAGQTHLSHAGSEGNGVAHALELLRELPSLVEPDFLELGARLRDYHARAQRLSEHSSGISASYAGDAVMSAIDSLQAVLERTKALRERAASGLEVMGALTSDLGKVRESTEGFGLIVRHLFALCNMIQIENARLGRAAEGFSTLADDVRGLVADVQGRASQLGQQSQSLSQLIEKYLKEAHRMEVGQRDRLRTILDDTMAHLQGLRDRQERAARTLADISSQWKAISSGISGIVVSLQSHDIVRQRIEHVVEVLEAIAAIERRPSRTVVQTMQLQQAQLRNTSAEAHESGTEIVRNLGSIAEGVLRISRQAEQACGSDDHLTSLDRLGEGLATISSTVGDYEEANRHLFELLERAAEPIKTMSGFVRDITRIGIAMRIVGLNACIHAARLGDRGLPLSVLAESIHQLSVQTSDHVRQVSDILTRIVTCSAGLSTATEDDQAVRMDGVHAHLDALGVRLTAMNDDARANLSRIDDDTRSLLDDLRQTEAGVDVHRRVEDGLSVVTSQLDGLMERMDGEAVDDDPEQAAALQALLGRYTMQSERSLHKEIFGDVGEAGEPGETTEGDDELGDFELF